METTWTVAWFFAALFFFVVGSSSIILMALLQVALWSSGNREYEIETTLMKAHLNLTINDPLVCFVCAVQVILLVYHVAILKTSNKDEIDWYQSEGGLRKLQCYTALLWLSSIATVVIVAL